MKVQLDKLLYMKNISAQALQVVPVLGQVKVVFPVLIAQVIPAVPVHKEIGVLRVIPAV